MGLKRTPGGLTRGAQQDHRQVDGTAGRDACRAFLALVVKACDLLILAVLAALAVAAVAEIAGLLP